MPCQRCVAVAVGLGAGRTSCMPTRAMTSRVAALICASLALRGVLPGVASSAMTGSGVIAGWLSAHTPGWQPSASCVLASNAGSIFTSRCFLWLAASSAFAISHRFVSHSKRKGRHPVLDETQDTELWRQWKAVTSSRNVDLEDETSILDAAMDLAEGMSLPLSVVWAAIKNWVDQGLG